MDIASPKARSLAKIPAVSMHYLEQAAVRPTRFSGLRQPDLSHPARLGQLDGVETSHAQAQAQAQAQSQAQREVSSLTRTARITRLRHLITKLETSACRAVPVSLSLGVPEIHRHLPGPGLASGVLHEVSAAAYGDGPAALGFLLALACLAQQASPGLAILIFSQRAFAQWGRPYGHGLRRLGVDPGRLMLVEAATDKEALWAMEETLRSSVRPAMVIGALESPITLTTSRRLNLAAATLATPLGLASQRLAGDASAAATCWRLGAMPAARDRFGSLSHPRWSASLERCRHGRAGQWIVEWNHVTHRFSLVEGMADRPSAQGTGIRILGCR
jgi:protein ImuA